MKHRTANDAVNAIADPERDTIVAIATPPGTGELAIVRVSGPAALAVFRGRGPLYEAASHTAHYGDIVRPPADRSGTGRVVDDVVATVFRGPGQLYRLGRGGDYLSRLGPGGRDRGGRAPA